MSSTQQTLFLLCPSSQEMAYFSLHLFKAKTSPSCLLINHCVLLILPPYYVLNLSTSLHLHCHYLHSTHHHFLPGLLKCSPGWSCLRSCLTPIFFRFLSFHDENSFFVFFPDNINNIRSLLKNWNNHTNIRQKKNDYLKSHYPEIPSLFHSLFDDHLFQHLFTLINHVRRGSELCPSLGCRCHRIALREEY